MRRTRRHKSEALPLFLCGAYLVSPIIIRLCGVSDLWIVLAPYYIPTAMVAAFVLLVLIVAGLDRFIGLFRKEKVDAFKPIKAKFVVHDPAMNELLGHAEREFVQMVEEIKLEELERQWSMPPVEPRRKSEK